MRTFGSPARCCCDPDPCDYAKILCFGSKIGACCSMDDHIDLFLTITVAGSEVDVGSCVLTPSIEWVYDPLTDSYSLPADGVHVSTCCIEVDLPVGTTVNWRVDGERSGANSGAIDVVCGTNGISVVDWQWIDSLPDTIHVTDPDGNAVPITRAGAVGTLDGRRWVGTRAYARFDTCGAIHEFTVTYEWFNCELTIDTTHFSITPGANFCSYNWDHSNPPLGTFAGLPDWTDPPLSSKSCDPLLMVYTGWWDILSSSGFGPHYTKKWTCFCGSDLFATFTTPYGCTWHKFDCASSWTVTL